MPQPGPLMLLFRLKSSLTAKMKTLFRWCGAPTSAALNIPHAVW
jgi:hypothetical protein